MQVTKNIKDIKSTSFDFPGTNFTNNTYVNVYTVTQDVKLINESINIV